MTPQMSAGAEFFRLLSTFGCVLLLSASCGCQQNSTNSAGQTGSPQVTSQVFGSTANADPNAIAWADADSSTETPNDLAIVRWVDVEDIPQPIAVFDMVFWEPDDTSSLRKLIRETGLVQGKRVLEIGTGTGLVSLCCLKAGASRVVATDINPNALSNAVYNVLNLGYSHRFEGRLVPRRAPSAWTVIGSDETFDLIVSNPPWEDQRPTSVADFALYDPGFTLMISMIEGARERLNPGGKMLLAYGCVTAVRKLETLSREHQLNFQILDDRRLDELPEVFLPGMLIEITVPSAEQADSGPAAVLTDPGRVSRSPGRLPKGLETGN